MKKTLSVILALVILCSLFAVGTADAKATSVYRSKIQAALNSSMDCGKYFADDAQGFLYDFDGNGVKELVLSYYTKVNGIPYKVCSVYTIKNNKVVTLIKQKKLYVAVGGPFAALGVAKKNGKSYLFCYWESGGTGGDSITRNGGIAYYKIKGTKISVGSFTKYAVKMNTMVQPNKILKTNIKKDGTKLTFNQFLKWQQSFRYSYVKAEKRSSKMYLYSDNSVKLATLLKKI